MGKPALKLESQRIRFGVTFVIAGDPVGYCTNNGRFYNTKRKKKYLEYKQLVQETVGRDIAGGLKFRSVGTRLSLPFALPLHADKLNPVFIRTEAYFRNGTHPDPENVHKGVKDALFYGAKGAGDKYTGGSYCEPRYDAENPRVIVTVEFDAEAR